MNPKSCHHIMGMKAGYEKEARFVEINNQVRPKECLGGGIALGNT